MVYLLVPKLIITGKVKRFTSQAICVKRDGINEFEKGLKIFMQTYCIKLILRMILLIIWMFPMSIHASNIKIMRLVTGDDGHSYLKKDTIKLLPSKVGVASDEIKVKTAVFGNAGTGSQALHNAPRPLYIIILSGIMQIETSKGDKHDFKAGEILLAEDLTGKGHKTRSLNDIPVSYLSMSKDE